MLLTATTDDFMMTVLLPLSSSTASPPSQFTNSVVLLAAHVSGRVTSVPPEVPATIAANPAQITHHRILVKCTNLQLDRISAIRHPTERNITVIVEIQIQT